MGTREAARAQSTAVCEEHHRIGCGGKTDEAEQRHLGGQKPVDSCRCSENCSSLKCGCTVLSALHIKKLELRTSLHLFTFACVQADLDVLVVTIAVSI